MNNVNEYRIATNTPISKITIGVNNKRIFGFRIPLAEKLGVIAKIPQGYILCHYERNKERTIISSLNSKDLKDWKFESFRIPRNGVTVKDLIRDIGKLWIFPTVRYIDKILPNLFRQQ